MDYGNAFGIGSNLVVRRIIQLLPSGIAMCAILRRFFITLTSDRHSEKEYERYDLVLNLYHSTPVWNELYQSETKYTRHFVIFFFDKRT